MACLLVAIQQVGFAHALSHLGNAPPSSRTDKQHPAEKACIECIAYAQIGAGLTGAVAPAPVPAAVTVVPEQPFRAFVPEFIPAFLSRGPPPAV